LNLACLPIPPLRREEISSEKPLPWQDLFSLSDKIFFSEKYDHANTALFRVFIRTSMVNSFCRSAPPLTAPFSVSAFHTARTGFNVLPLLWNGSGGNHFVKIFLPKKR
ncbi:MAG: hypothetical protein U0M82_06490, partial [Bilophila wadsworthia]